MKIKTILCTIAITCLGLTVTMAQKTSLNTGEILRPGEEIQSRNGKFVFRAHDGAGGGQFCTYTAKEGKSQTFLPHTCFGKTKYGKVRLELRADGNLVILTEKNEVVWGSSTIPEHDPRFKDKTKKPVKMMVEDDGSIGLYAASGEKVWYHKR